MVTDYGEGDNTDFILSTRAYTRLARPNMASELLAYGVVNVEYRRISCRYAGYNILFKIHEYSRYPDYLAIVIMYQGGQNDIVALEIWKVRSSDIQILDFTVIKIINGLKIFIMMGVVQEDSKEWVAMRRAFGAVFDMANPPKGRLTLRFKVSAGQTWALARNVIPNDWKAGVAYDSTIQLT